MPSQSEKTHAKNLENLHIANNIVAGLGAIYDPTNPIIDAAALTAFETAMSDKMQTLNAVIPARQAAVGAQMTAFKKVSPRLSKIMKAVKAQSITGKPLETLTKTVANLRGVRISPKTPDNPATAGIDESTSNSSVSQRSYAGILESLDIFDEQIKAQTAYNPNEPEYKKPAVTAWINDLRALHNAALASKTPVTTALAARNAFAYNETTGIVPRMNALKNYAATILDDADPRLKQLKKLRFADFSK